MRPRSSRWTRSATVLIGGEIVAEFFADVREIDARQDQHAAILRVDLGSQRIDERCDSRIARRRDSALDHFVERTHQDRHHLVAANPERIGEEQRLEFDRMLAAMQHLVSEQVAVVACCEPIDKRAVGLDRAKRRRVVLARRAEQFGAGAIVRGSKDHHQLGQFVRHQLVVRMRIGGGAPARIDMRRDQTRERRCFLRGGDPAGSFGRIEERRELEPQFRRILLVAKASQRRRTVGTREKFLAHDALALVKRRRVEKVRTIERRDQLVELLDRNHLAEALRKRELNVFQRHPAVEQRHDEVRAHPEHDSLGREPARIAQTDQRLIVLLDGESLDGANLRIFHRVYRCYGL